jgi:hypothetical protein
MDVKGILQPILNHALPSINEAVTDGMKSGGLDPWKDVLSEKLQLGELSLPLGRVSAHAEVSITEITGLGSLGLKSLTVESANLEFANASDVSLTWSCAFDSDLTAQVRGTVGATTASWSPSVDLKGSARVTGVTGAGDATASVKGQFSLTTPFCVAGFEVSSVSVSYKDAIVNIEGLGELNDILKHVSRAVQEMVGKTITIKVPPAIQRIVHDAIKGVLPICS